MATKRRIYVHIYICTYTYMYMYRGKTFYFRCTSCKVRSFFTYQELSQHLQTCFRKTIDVVVTGSQPASSRAINDLQSTTQSLQRQIAREMKNTQTLDAENRTCVRYLTRFEMHMNVLLFGRKKYSCFQQVQLKKST